MIPLSPNLAGDELLIAIENELQAYLDRLALLMDAGLVIPVYEEDQSDG